MSTDLCDSLCTNTTLVHITMFNGQFSSLISLDLLVASDTLNKYFLF